MYWCRCPGSCGAQGLPLGCSFLEMPAALLGLSTGMFLGLCPVGLPLCRASGPGGSRSDGRPDGRARPHRARLPCGAGALTRRAAPSLLPTYARGPGAGIARLSPTPTAFQGPKSTGPVRLPSGASACRRKPLPFQGPPLRVPAQALPSRAQAPMARGSPRPPVLREAVHRLHRRLALPCTSCVARDKSPTSPVSISPSRQQG